MPHLLIAPLLLIFGLCLLFGLSNRTKVSRRLTRWLVACCRWSHSRFAPACRNREANAVESASSLCDGQTVRTVNRFSGVVLSSFLLVGCVTKPFAESYRDYPADVDSAGVAARFMPYSGTTTLRVSKDLDGDGVNLTRDGYILVGTFVYEGRDPVTIEQIIAQGEKVRTDVVLYRTGTGISRAAVAITDYPGAREALHQSQAPNAGMHGYGAATAITTTYARESMPNRPGTIATTMVPTERLPVHAATFWRKAMPKPMTIAKS